MKLKPQQERFAQELFKMERQPELSLTQVQCYKIAYPNQAKGSKDSTLESHASRLAKSDKIVARLNELRKPFEDKLVYTALQSFKRLDHIQKLALEGEKIELMPAIKTEELKGKLAQLYVEKQESKVVNSVIEIKDEDFIKKVLKELKEC